MTGDVVDERVVVDDPRTDADRINVEPRRPGIVAALVAFQLDLPTVTKDSTANVKSDRGGFRYTYADLSDVSAVVLPALAKQGIAYTAPLVRVDDARYVVLARLVHTSGESIDSEWPIPVGPPQQMGSAITYGRRYCLLTMCGVHPTGEDDDGAGGSQRVPRTPDTIPEVEPLADDRDPLLITEQQRKRLWSQLKRADMANEDVAREWMGSVLGIPPAKLSTRSLTKAQVAILFDELKALIGRSATRTRPTGTPPADQWMTVDPQTGELGDVFVQVDP